MPASSSPCTILPSSGDAAVIASIMRSAADRAPEPLKQPAIRWLRIRFASTSQKPASNELTVLYSLRRSRPLRLLSRARQQAVIPKCLPRLFGVPLLLEIPGHRDGGDALVASQQQQRLEALRALVMEHIVIPLVLHQFRNDDRDFAGGVFLAEIDNVIDQRSYDRTEWRSETNQLRDGQAGGARRLFHQTRPRVF